MQTHLTPETPEKECGSRFIVLIVEYRRLLNSLSLILKVWLVDGESTSSLTNLQKVWSIDHVLLLPYQCFIELLFGMKVEDGMFMIFFTWTKNRTWKLRLVRMRRSPSRSEWLLHLPDYSHCRWSFESRGRVLHIYCKWFRLVLALDPDTSRCRTADLSASIQRSSPDHFCHVRV